MTSSWNRLHESVLVGYFCQAIGWLTRDVIESRKDCVSDSDVSRLTKAVNLSHNPFDPAVGRASTGSMRFAFAYKEYDMYLFNEASISELHKIREQDKKRIAKSTSRTRRLSTQKTLSTTAMIWECNDNGFQHLGPDANIWLEYKLSSCVQGFDVLYLETLFMIAKQSEIRVFFGSTLYE